MSATIVGLKPLRHTPAGVPALDLEIEHASVAEEAGQQRQVKVALRAVALGMLAERMATQAVGSSGCFRGFLASPRRGRTVVLHIQEFHTD
ncbi:MAG: primosomal replication protein N [Ottowia sp.]|nr:primosomal replication protein N [Ottowia sp.]